jgi:hypothetical protein
VGVITWQEYTNYIWNNYPGDSAALIARAGNREYDGPDGWDDAGNNNVMISGPQLGFDAATPMAVVEPGGSYGISGWQKGDWASWWTNEFETGSAPQWAGWAPNVVDFEGWSATTNGQQVGVGGELQTQVGPDSDDYSGSLANDEVIPGSLDMRVGTFNISDDGAGTLSDSASNFTGSISYSSGEWSLQILTENLFEGNHLLFASYTFHIDNTADGTTNAQPVYDEPAVALNTYPSVAYPPRGSTWGYDSPREFVDLASSFYHESGDWRFGEEIDPWTRTVNAVDRSDGNNPENANAFNPDMVVPASGPEAYNINGVHGLDTASQAAIEYMTWRTDGTHLTGPTNVHPAAGDTPVRYAGDHRDVDLDGLIDQGETLPASSANYMTDWDPGTPDNGMDSRYPFNWERWFEDMVEIWDHAEDFAALSRANSSVPRSSADLPVINNVVGDDGPFALTNGVESSDGMYLHEVEGPVSWYKSPGGAARGYFDAELDDLWFDSNANGIYDAEPVLNRENGGALSNGVAGTAFGDPVVIDFDADGSFTYGSDVIFNDENANGQWDSELVLRDPQGVLHDGAQGTLLSSVIPGLTNYWQDVNTNGVRDASDNFWYESGASAGDPDSIPASYESSDRILHAGTAGALTTGVASAGTVTNVYFYNTPAGGAGFTVADGVWIDSAPADGTYEAEPIIHNEHPRGMEFDSNRNTDGTATISPAHPVLWADVGGTAGYDRHEDFAWSELVGDGVYTEEEVINDLSPEGLENGDQGTIVENVGWYDAVADGEFTQLTLFGKGSQNEYYVGDALWIDNNGDDKRYFSRRPPIYTIGLHPPGLPSAGVKHSGVTWSCPTRDGVSISGFDQLSPADNRMTLTHEQSHDVRGVGDLYDYDVYDPDVANSSVGPYDLMAQGGMVHGVAQYKWESPWPALEMQNLNDILVKGGGKQTAYLYPVERFADQYYQFVSPSGTEAFRFWYQDGASEYSGPGGRAVHITHYDRGNVLGQPYQQRSNLRTLLRIVQSDAGTDYPTGSDTFPGPQDVRLFTADTEPAAKWWDGSDAGIRILDIRIPENAWEPAEVDFEWIETGDVPWKNIEDDGSFVDADEDGIPDAWEYHWFRDNADPLAVAGRGTDWDGDGLTDFEEWKLDLDPTMQDTDSDGIDDYQDDADQDGIINGIEGQVNRTGSEIDGDRIPDEWELQYMGIVDTTGRMGLDPAYYDADRDPDEDGWSNYAEYLGYRLADSGALQRRTNPLDSESYPMPMVKIIARYHGKYAGHISELLNGTAGGTNETGQATNVTLRLSFYDSPEMDGFPVASHSMSSPTVEVRELDSGHLVEGGNYVFGYLDMDGDGAYSPKQDPAGISQTHPFDVCWADSVEVAVGLTDWEQSPGYTRFSWTPDANVTEYTIGGAVAGNTNFSRVMEAPRNYWHEGDYLHAGTYGFGPNETNIVWNIYTNMSLYGKNYPQLHETTFFWVTNDVAGTVPEIVTPRDFTYVYAANDLEWKMDPAATAYRLQFRMDGHDIMETTPRRAPFRNSDGVYRQGLPFYVGDEFAAGGAWTNDAYWGSSPAWTNGRYEVRVQALFGSEMSASQWSQWQPFNLDVRQPANGGRDMIEGMVHYFGAATNVTGNGADIVVESYTSRDLCGVPDARAIVPGGAVNGSGASGMHAPFSLKGLHNGAHSVMAFVDLDGDRQLDTFEPWGFITDARHNEEASVLDLSDTGGQKLADQDLVILDRDTDNDELSDAWEWMHYGSLNKGTYDTAGNGLSMLMNYQLAHLGVVPTVAGGDVDGDGLTDYEEVNYDGDPDSYDPGASDTDLTASDTDGDHLSDDGEAGIAGPDPLKYDTDGDGVNDFLELTYSEWDTNSYPTWTDWTNHVAANRSSIAGWYMYSPFDPGTGGGTDLVVDDPDSDNGGISDYDELMGGTDPLNASDDTVFPVTSADGDGDGLDDSWEEQHFGGIAATEGLEDSDGDGATNLEEYTAKTDPNDPSSMLRIMSVETEPDMDPTLTWEGQPGVSYGVRYKDSLMATSWTDAGITRSGGGTHTYTDSGADLAETRYYQIYVK